MKLDKSQNRNVKKWLLCWKSIAVFFCKTKNSEQADSWNRRWSRPADDIAVQMTHKWKQKRMEEIFGMLGEGRCKVEDARVLDLNCGTGSTSITFAKVDAEVTALNTSSTTLSCPREDRRKEGVSIETIESSWWTTDINRLDLRNKFYLVFVTSTAAKKKELYKYFKNFAFGGRIRTKSKEYSGTMVWDVTRKCEMPSPLIRPSYSSNPEYRKKPAGADSA